MEELLKKYPQLKSLADKSPAFNHHIAMYETGEISSEEAFANCLLELYHNNKALAELNNHHKRLHPITRV